MLEYVIDKDDNFISVNEEWNLFLKENAPNNISLAKMEGEKLWDHIKDNEISQIYKYLLSKVRNENCSIEFDFRCDSTTMKRYMRMEIIPLPDNCILFRSKLLKSERYEYRHDKAHKHKINREILYRCSICGKIKHKQGWFELEHLVNNGIIFNRDNKITLCYTICKTCYKILSPSNILY